MAVTTPDDSGAAHERGGVFQDEDGNGIKGTSMIGRHARVSVFVRGVRGSVLV